MPNPNTPNTQDDHKEGGHNNHPPLGFDCHAARQLLTEVLVKKGSV